MSRAENRRRTRNAQSSEDGRPGRGRHPAWILGASVVAAFLVLAVMSQVGGATLHPTPRATEMASDVVPDARYVDYPRARAAYQIASAVPTVLDGLYCYCHCEGHSGHYSLLDCYASDHAAACDVCMSEAELAYEMSGQGASMDDIRSRVDRTYGG